MRGEEYIKLFYNINYVIKYKNHGKHQKEDTFSFDESVPHIIYKRMKFIYQKKDVRRGYYFETISRNTKYNY